MRNCLVFVESATRLNPFRVNSGSNNLTEKVDSHPGPDTIGEIDAPLYTWGFYYMGFLLYGIIITWIIQ